MPGVGIKRTLACRSALLRLWNEAATPSPAAKAAERAEQEITDDEDDDAADAEAAGDQRKQAAETTAAQSAAAEAHAAAPCDIFKIAALTLVAEPHRDLLLQGRNAWAADRLQFDRVAARDRGK